LHGVHRKSRDIAPPPFNVIYSLSFCHFIASHMTRVRYFTFLTLSEFLCKKKVLPHQLLLQMSVWKIWPDHFFLQSMFSFRRLSCFREKLRWHGKWFISAPVTKWKNSVLIFFFSPFLRKRGNSLVRKKHGIKQRSNANILLWKSWCRITLSLQWFTYTCAKLTALFYKFFVKTFLIKNLY